MGRIGEHLSSALGRGESLSVAALAEVVQPDLIQDALSEAEALQEQEARSDGRKPRKRRDRKLPGELTVWLMVGMALYRTLPIRGVLRRIVDGIPGFARFGVAELPVSTSLAHARDRIGRSMQFLFERLAARLATKHEAANTWLDLVVNAIDGSCFLMPDERANDRYFGRPGAPYGGVAAFPQMRSVLLIAAFTHLVVHAALGPYKVGELALAQTLLPMIAPGSLTLMDRAYYAYAWLACLAAKRAFFLVRVKKGKRALKAVKTKTLGKNDWLATVAAPRAVLRDRPELATTLEIRLIRCEVKGYPRVLLATNLLDHVKYPAEALARLYFERWEAELTLREIKVHQAARTTVTFRSHTPERVTQEFYGTLVAYNCVRALMADTARETGCDPRLLSFAGCLERIVATIPLFAFASPADHATILDRLCVDLACCPLPAKRVGRRCRREIKIQISRWPRKRPRSRRRSPPSRPRPRKGTSTRVRSSRTDRAARH